MSTLRELKGRICSAKSSEKITGAMKMISSAKMHKAVMGLHRLEPYRNQIQSIIQHLLSADAEYSSVLTDERDVKNITIVALGSDDGLCGAYNIQIFKGLLSKINEIRENNGNSIGITIVPVGRKMTKACEKIDIPNINVDYHYKLTTRSDDKAIKDFASDLMTCFINKACDRVEIIYTHFHSAGKQILSSRRLLPVVQSSLVNDNVKLENNKPYIFEPDANTIFNTVLPLFVRSSMQEITVENIASEQAARVMAMQTANDNAKNLLGDLQLEYNKLRQQSITTELLDILGGQTRD